jgi:hypothetical protein
MQALSTRAWSCRSHDGDRCAEILGCFVECCDAIQHRFPWQSTTMQWEAVTIRYSGFAGPL